MEQVIEGLSLEEREGSVSDPASHRDLDQEHANQHRTEHTSASLGPNYGPELYTYVALG